MHILEFIFSGLTRSYEKGTRNPSFTKKGPGRSHRQGAGHRRF